MPSHLRHTHNWRKNKSNTSKYQQSPVWTLLQLKQGYPLTQTYMSTAEEHACTSQLAACFVYFNSIKNHNLRSPVFPIMLIHIQLGYHF